MAISYITAPQEIGITEANAVFDALDTALSILFNGQSPLLYLPWSGASSYSEAGLAGVRFVFGTKASRKIFSAVDSHDQAAITTTVNAASTVGSPDHTLKQVTLDLLPADTGSSLIAHTRDTTPPTGPDEPYWVRVEFVSGYYQHEHPHELAVADVIFEGHAGRTFTWESEWNKFRCIRFHNLDSDATPLVITIDETGDTVSLGPWECVTVRRSADGTSWDEQGYLLWRMRADDLERFGGTMPWNDRRRATAGATSDSVWVSDGANNVASWALVWWLIDYFSTPITPPEVADQCGDGVSDAFDNRTGFHFDFSDFTRNAGTLSPFPDPTADATPLYQLAWHGGRMIVVTTNLDTTTSTVTAAPTIAQLLAGDAASGLTLEIDVGGNSAHLLISDETGKDYVDVIPLGTNIGASGNPFAIDANGIGYNMPPAFAGTWSGIKRWADDTTLSDTVQGIGANATTDYVKLKAENASDGSVAFPPFDATIGDIKAWAFADTTKNNDHGTFASNSVKWDGRRVAVNVELEVLPADGKCPKESVVATLCGASGASQETVKADYAKLNWYQVAVIQQWPAIGAIWFTPDYARRAKAQLDPAIAHPYATDYYGTSAGDDWSAPDTRRFPRSSGAVARQNPLESGSGTHNVVSPELSCCYLEAKDSSEFIVQNIETAGWWASNRTTAIAGSIIGSEERPAIAVPIMARHYNVLAQRLNSLMTVYPFSFFDSQYYGRLFRPDYSDGGIFGGHVYPFGFLCYSTGAVATRASDLGMTVRDFQTEFSGYGAYSDCDVDIVDGSGVVGAGFSVAGGTGLDAWNVDLPYWFAATPSPSLARNESVQINDVSPGTGWVQGELVFSTTGPDVDWYAWVLPNDSAYAFPDFDYIRADDAKAVADSLGIPFRLIRLFSTWEPYQFTPDRLGLGCRVVESDTLSSTWTRSEVRLVPEITFPSFVMFAGTGEDWGTNGLVRVSDWTACPATQGSDDAVVQSSNADPMHGLNRSGAGDVIEYPYGFTPAVGTLDTTWANDCPFEGEAASITWEAYDTTPTPPTGWAAGDHRLASYPVPATQWGATDIEDHGAPSCNPAFIRLADLAAPLSAGGLWADQGTGVWSGEGAFAVHLVTAGINKT